jgi:uncharacterized protein (TIGR03435 family)
MVRVIADGSLAIILLSGAFAQQPAPRPAFEVASVKPCLLSKNGAQPGFSIAGNRVNVTFAFRKLVEFAYDVKGYEISGGPEWISGQASDAYCIAAKVEGERMPGTDEVRQMLQSLLADRFQLKLHRETKDLPVYALVVGKNQPKLKLSSPSTEYSMRVARRPNQVQLAATGDTMVQFASGISGYMDRPVVDKTGLTGHYDFKLEWTLDPKNSPALDPGGTSIFTAVQEQLGLKLDQRLAPMEVLVIDHAVRVPTEN